jgi:hypothetical protein
VSLASYKSNISPNPCLFSFVAVALDLDCLHQANHLLKVANATTLLFSTSSEAAKS